MHSLVILSFLTLVVGVAYCEDNALLEWRSHCKRVRSFHCGKPQNRTVDIQEIVDFETWTQLRDVQIWPHRTVLQRCPSSGSCGKWKSCQADRIEDRHLVFRFKNDTSHRLQYLSVVAEEHVSCRCQSDEQAHD